MSLILMPNPPRDDAVSVEVGQRLSRVRDALGLTQEQLADALNVGRTTLANWETGVRLADVAAIARMSVRFGPVLEWVYNGSTASMPNWLVEKVLAEEPAEKKRQRSA